MPAPRLHELLIADRIVSLIDQNLSGPMGLKVVTMEALELFPALQDITDNVPAVFVKPSPSTTLERITTGQTYQIAYAFRIVLVRRFAAGEQVVRSTVTEAQKIAELLIDNVELGALALPNGQIIRSLLKAIEWEPAEESVLLSINASLAAAALVFNVETVSRK